ETPPGRDSSGRFSGRRERSDGVPRAWANPRNKKILATAASSATRASSTVMSLPHEALRPDELHAPHRTMASGLDGVPLSRRGPERYYEPETIHALPEEDRCAEAR